MMPTVSVVVPCYNGGKFLDHLLASLARQTYRDFETVIINDGSTDPATIEKLKTLDPSILVVHQANKGLSAARNTGFREARADIVLALDCDDQLEPTHIEETLRALQDVPDAGFVTTDIRQVGAGQAIETRYVNAFDVLFKNVTGYCMLMRKTAWQKAGGYDESMRDGYEDWEFNIRLLNSGFKSVTISKPLLIYTVSAQGMLLGHSSQRHAALWRRIREKHRDLYRISNIARLYWQNRNAHTEISPFSTVAALALATILPDRWYSALIHTMRNYRLARAQRSAAVMRPGALRTGAGPTA